MKLYQSLFLVSGCNFAGHNKMHALHLVCNSAVTYTCVSPVNNERDSRRTGMEEAFFPVASTACWSAPPSTVLIATKIKFHKHSVPPSGRWILLYYSSAPRITAAPGCLSRKNSLLWLHSPILGRREPSNNV